MFYGSADAFEKAVYIRLPLVAKDILLLTVHQEEVRPAHRIVEKLIAFLRLIREIIQLNERDVGIIRNIRIVALLCLKANANVDVCFFIMDDQELSRKRAESDRLS